MILLTLLRFRPHSSSQYKKRDSVAQWENSPVGLLCQVRHVLQSPSHKLPCDLIQQWLCTLPLHTSAHNTKEKQKKLS